ncbi:hypothetical protein EYF80_023290 [Liparis tanakae]|uniref:Uncharacterized protein n=1 Tax=Liparis tanakae TaxID=230148 RepID=A0A4Z2HL89_9TELE|nr:hypothetical protein EYF80_023290 [Liparis tanakae]
MRLLEPGNQEAENSSVFPHPCPSSISKDEESSPPSEAANTLRYPGMVPIPEHKMMSLALFNIAMYMGRWVLVSTGTVQLTSTSAAASFTSTGCSSPQLEHTSDAHSARVAADRPPQDPL